MVATSRAMTQPSRFAQSMRLASALASSESHSSLNRRAIPLRRMCLGLCPLARFMRAFSPAREIGGGRETLMVADTAAPDRPGASARPRGGGDRRRVSEPRCPFRRLPRLGDSPRLEREGGVMDAAERIEYMRHRLMTLYLKWLKEGEPVR